MSKFLSGRIKELLLGVVGRTEDKTVLQTTGTVGIGTTNSVDYTLYVNGSTNIDGGLTVGSASTFVGVSTFKDDVYIDNQLYVSGVNISGSVTIDEDINARNLNLTGIATVAGLTDLNGDFNVAGVSTFQDRAIFDSTNSIQIPVGTEGEKDSVGVAVTGQIRFNTTNQQFEGFGVGNNWGSLGGVKDVDGDTEIKAELSAGSDEDNLYFYNGGYLSATISSEAFTVNVPISLGYNLEVTGIATVSGDLDVDGHTNLDNVSISGVTTFSANIDANGDLDVDGHTNLDNVSISGVTTFSANIDANGDLDVDGTTELDVLNVAETATFSANIDANGDLDVDGHTNLDNVSVAGVTTFTGAIDANSDLDVDGHTNLDNVDIAGVTTTSGLLDINAGGQANTFKVEDLTDNRVVIAGTGGELEDDANLTFNGSTLAVGVNLDVTGDLDVDGHTNLDNVSISGVSTFSGAVDIDGDIDIDGHIDLDNVSISGVTTFSGLVDINDGGQANTFQVEDLTSGRVVLAGTGGELEDSANLTYDDNQFNVVGHTELDDVNVSGIATITSLDVQTNFDVYDSVATFHNNVHIDGNLSIGGTTTALQARDLQILDKDIILGVTTDAFGNDISTDITANHAGVAVASTEGSPLVDLFIPGLEELPTTYKKIMWFKEGSFSGLGTDAWLFNYAVGIGSTQFPSGTRLAVSETQITDDTLTTPNISVTNDLTIGGNIIGTGDLTLTDTDSGSSAGPELKLYRNSSSPADADYLGQIKFAGESDTGVERNYAKITGKILDASNGTEDGIIEIEHIKAGSQNISARFRSDSLQLLNDTNFSVAGDSTFTGNVDANANVDIQGTLDVDGHTELDNVNVSGATTIFKANGSDLLHLTRNTSGGGTDLGFKIGVGNSSANATNIQISRISGNTSILNITDQGDIYPSADGSVDLGRTNNRFDNLYVQNIDSNNVDLTLKPGLSSNLTIEDSILGETRAVFTPNQVELYYDNSKKFETTGYGVTVFGTTETQQLSITGVSTYAGLVDINAGGQANTFKVEDLTDNRVVIAGTGGELEDDANLTFNGSTLSVGVDLDVDGHTELDNLNVSGISTFQNNIHLLDDDRLQIGGSVGTVDGLEIYHDGSDSYIDDTGTGALQVKASAIIVRSNLNENMAQLYSNGAVKLFHDNSQKFETTGYGVTVFGTTETQQLNVSGIATVNHIDANSISPDGSDTGASGYVPVADGSGGWNWLNVSGASAVNTILNGFTVNEEGVVVGTAASITTLDFRGGNVLVSADPQPNGIATITFSPNPVFDTLNVTGISTFSDDLTISNSSLKVTNTSTTGNYLEAYQDTSGAFYLNKVGSGAFFIEGNNIYIGDDGSNETYAGFQKDGSSYLNHDGTKRLETTGYGATVYNDLRVGTGVTIYGNSGIVSATAFYGDGSNLLNTGATLSAATGTQRLVLTSLTSGTMVDAATDSDLTYDATSDKLNVANIDISGISTLGGPVTAGTSEGVSGQYLRHVGTGVTWASFPTLRTTQTSSAANGQTTFNFTYNVNFLDVFINGVKLTSSEYTASNGTSVVLATPAFGK